ncbi:DEAD/DEAH box helicase [Halioxenophilus aromaticivorans]|uniref:DEAD-box ATP-dependent RNA helicase RhpA n=1 Tax=Halioxenophilus aromaticivorans TaxID=1306992 RepID=A0AAV3TYA0_9ALTE
MLFTELGLQEQILKAITDNGYTQPTPIQAQAIPAILSGKDVMAAAQTGTGKTAGFTLPVLQHLSKGRRAGANRVRALVLTPTRELAAQVLDSVETYGKGLPLSARVVFGGVKINPQMMALRKGADILVATPGRLLDLHNQNALRFDDLEILVLDEADRMLDMGFIHDIKRILKVLPTKRQNLMFSATFSDDIRKLASGICNNPVQIDVAPRNSTVETVTQQVYEVAKENKVHLLTSLLKTNSEQTIVFSRTKHGANKLVKVLDKAGVQSAAIHGNKSQNQRTKALDDFKQDRIQVLVATDIAARGIDIDQLAQVINFDLPNVSEDYVHRIGRTGRAGATGVAISLVAPEETKLLRDIERLIKRKIERLNTPAFEVVKGEVPDFADRPKGQNRGQGRRQNGNASGNRNGNRNSGNRAEANRSRPQNNPDSSRNNSPDGETPKPRRPRRKSRRPVDADGNAQDNSRNNSNERRPQQGNRNRDEEGGQQRQQQRRRRNPSGERKTQGNQENRGNAAQPQRADSRTVKSPSPLSKLKKFFGG